MSGAAAFSEQHPGVFFLDSQDVGGMSEHLRSLGWISDRENIIGAERAGEGNMNYTLRVRTTDRTFILKQARPWVEKYPHIEAPWDRAVVEGRFYELVATRKDLAKFMPKLLGVDAAARLLCLEDLGEAQDFTPVYTNAKLAFTELTALMKFVSALHKSFRAYSERSAFSNIPMRELNHQHIFVIPLRADNGLNLDAITPGLGEAANDLKSDVGYREEVLALGSLYLSEGDCLLHGDYFPGSWLRTSAGIKVIDPEFCFFGPPEFDLGVMLAHLYLAQHRAASRDHLLKRYRNPVDEELMVRFAGVEIMRRLIGVAQLPLRMDLREKTGLLEQSRKMVLDGA